MYYYICYLLSGAILAGALALLYMQNLEADQFTPQAAQRGCVQTFNGGRQGNGQTSFRFYNGCPEDLYINVCVLSTNGEAKLYQSGRRVLSNGNYTISTFPDQTPRSITWSADPYKADIPPLCNQPNRSF